LAHSAWHQGWYDDAGDVLLACQEINIHNVICIIKTPSPNPAHYMAFTSLNNEHL
jgi:hypothetical protein